MWSMTSTIIKLDSHVEINAIGSHQSIFHDILFGKLLSNLGLKPN
jgi:hypothetical protein